ncbi:hypothetical protein [Marinobacter lutaoensis]|uniref:hypothetical protein n=1 Tax=Marinobacter lutaoensis TaxID=135739 RepID=UPI001593C8AE|nr:hypothetical protein [Marinobacter lutaoensis]NVD34710.1 hypothetical protein [Marinobacter lutaoensis]
MVSELDVFAAENEERRPALLEGYYRVITSQALDVTLRGLARVDCSFNPVHRLFCVDVLPVNTTTFNSCFSVHIHHDLAFEFEDVYQESIANLELVKDFLSGLIEKGEPLLVYETQEEAA